MYTVDPSKFTICLEENNKHNVYDFYIRYECSDSEKEYIKEHEEYWMEIMANLTLYAQTKAYEYSLMPLNVMQ